MLLLHEVHTVAGRHEDEFEARFRDGWLPALAAGDDARLCYYLKLAHGTGRAYHHVSITALRDGNAYEALARRVQQGDLRAWAADVDRLRHEVKGKLLLQVDWSPMRTLDLATVPTDGREHDPVLYMEDSAWPYEAKLDTYLDGGEPVEVMRNGRAVAELVPRKMVLETGATTRRPRTDFRARFLEMWGPDAFNSKVSVEEEFAELRRERTL